MKWCFKPVAVVVAIIVVGPFALPLVWMSPAFKKWQKAAITVLLVAMTVWLVKASAHIFSEFSRQLNDLKTICQ